MLTFKGTGDPVKCTAHLATYVYQVHFSILANTPMPMISSLD